MAFWCVVVVLILSLCGSQANSELDDSLNTYIDMVLDNSQILMVNEGYDPVALPNGTMGFNRTILGVTWYGEAGIYDGYLAGLSTIERTGDARFILDVDGNVAGTESKMTVVTLKAYYKGTVTFMDLGPTVTVTSYVNGVDIWFQSELLKDTCVFRVSALDVQRIGHISVDIVGLGPLNWIFEMMSEFVANIIRLFIRDMFDNPVQEILNEGLGYVDVSVIGVPLDCTPVDSQYLKQEYRAV
ncbi:uncharacterized protein LOC143033460 isoform X2 [Oratosquilla oratoria]